MIPDDFKQQLLNRVDIVDVIERHVQLRKAGQNYVARCPFHNEKTPSFSVSPTKQFYHCFGCGAHGNAISFLMEYGGTGYVDAIRDLAGMVGMTVPESGRATPRRTEEDGLAATLATAARYYKEQLRSSPSAIEYLKSRGLTGEMAARFGLGYAPSGWRNLATVFPEYESERLVACGLVIKNEEGRCYDRFRDRVMFPITDQRGGVIGFGGRTFGLGQGDGPKYLNTPETAIFQKGNELFGLFQARQSIRKNNRVVVVEGYMDVISLHQHGVDYAVATLGTATTSAHVAKLLKLADELFFCFDGDAAGRKAAWRALENSLPQLVDGKQISFMFFPEGEDPDSYVRKCAQDDVWKTVPLSEFAATELGGSADLQTAEGRAALLARVRPLLAKVSAPGFSLQLRHRFAALARVSIEELDALFGLKSAHVRPQVFHARERFNASRTTPVTLTRRVLRAVLSDPTLAVKVERNVLDDSDRHYPALDAVLRLIAERPGLAAKDIVPLALDALDDEAIRSRLREDVAELMANPGVDVEAEFEDTIARLADEAARRRTALLIAKLNRSPAEEEELASLVRSRVRAPNEPPARLGSRV